MPLASVVSFIFTGGWTKLSLVNINIKRRKEKVKEVNRKVEEWKKRMHGENEFQEKIYEKNKSKQKGNFILILQTIVTVVRYILTCHLLSY